MIAEVIPGTYDVEGRKVLRPFDRRRSPKPTYPLGRYVSCPLTIHCGSLEEVRAFLKQCKYVSDRELFDKDDYWQPPDDFEKRKQGDCEDFAFWTWRQCMGLGYKSRIVFGQHGRYGDGHAWVQIVQGRSWYIIEPLRQYLGPRFPRLNTLGYHPKFSVEWDGEKLSYFAHKEKQVPPIFSLIGFLPEYLSIWGSVWFTRLPRLPFVAWYLSKRFMRGIRWTRRRPADS